MQKICKDFSCLNTIFPFFYWQSMVGELCEQFRGYSKSTGSKDPVFRADTKSERVEVAGTLFAHLRNECLVETLNFDVGNG